MSIASAKDFPSAFDKQLKLFLESTFSVSFERHYIGGLNK